MATLALVPPLPAEAAPRHADRATIAVAASLLDEFGPEGTAWILAQFPGSQLSRRIKAAAEALPS